MLDRRHTRIMTEVRALTHEADQLQRIGGERALGMFAVAEWLSEVCHYKADPEGMLTEAVHVRLEQLQGYIDETTDVRRHMAIEQGERTRPYPLSPHEELVQIVDIAASDAYLTYARTSGISQDNIRQYPGSCSPLFYVMQHELRKQGVETNHMWWFEAGNNHHFLHTSMPNGDQIYIDPTWQQYLPEGTDYSQHPNVLIAPADQFIGVLAYHGVPESKHRSWSEAQVDPRPERNQWNWDSALEEIFEADPWIPSLPLHEQRFYTR